MLLEGKDKKAILEAVEVKRKANIKLNEVEEAAVRDEAERKATEARAKDKSILEGLGYVFGIGEESLLGDLFGIGVEGSTGYVGELSQKVVNLMKGNGWNTDAEVQENRIMEILEKYKYLNSNNSVAFERGTHGAIAFAVAKDKYFDSLTAEQILQIQDGAITADFNLSTFGYKTLLKLEEKYPGFAYIGALDDNNHFDGLDAKGIEEQMQRLKKDVAELGLEAKDVEERIALIKSKIANGKTTINDLTELTYLEKEQAKIYTTLGMKTHKIQDFYAHSNFEELKQQGGYDQKMTYEDIANLDDKGKKFFQDNLKTGHFSVSTFVSGLILSKILPGIYSDGANYSQKVDYFANNYYSNLPNGKDDHFFLSKDREDHPLHWTAKNSAVKGTGQLLEIFFQNRGRYIITTTNNIPPGAG